MIGTFQDRHFSNHSRIKEMTRYVNVWIVEPLRDFRSISRSQFKSRVIDISLIYLREIEELLQLKRRTPETCKDCIRFQNTSTTKYQLVNVQLGTSMVGNNCKDN